MQAEDSKGIIWLKITPKVDIDCCLLLHCIHVTVYFNLYEHVLHCIHVTVYLYVHVLHCIHVTEYLLYVHVLDVSIYM